LPSADTFAIEVVDVPAPGPGQVLVRNDVLSVDPYMRGRMNDAPSYVPPFEVGKVMDGGAVGTVVEANDAALDVGTVVSHGQGWREYAVGDAAEFRPVDTGVAPASAYLGVLGMPGLTAYVGLTEIAAMRAGDAVFVSGAAGAVGSLAGQLARLRGASRVVGSAGTKEKIDYLTGELGFDAAFDYHDGPVRDRLAGAAPDGIDVYFDNVGGEQLEAAIGAMRQDGRIAMCGAISAYNATEPTPGPRNLFLSVVRRLTLRGFIVGDHAALRPEFLREVGGWLAEGRIGSRETAVDGIENAPEAFLGLYRGDNIGKMLVRLHPDGAG
jgi:NADPH-dependent curcumin reductase CurA